MKKVLLAIALLLILLFLDGRFLETRYFKIHEYNIKNENIADAFEDFKIIQFSDILFNENRSIDYVKKIVKDINNHKPDIIVFTGDLIDDQYKIDEKDQKELTEALKSLDCTLYKYAITGENDNKNIDLYRNILEQSNFKLLNNSKEYIFYKDINPLRIIGINDLTNLDDLFVNEEGINPFYTLVLTHYPDNIDKISNYNPNLILAGHSLGGIIKVPFYGNLIKKENAKKYPYDYIKINNTDVYISNGLGQEGFDFRLFNRPSYNIYRLEK